MRFEPGSSHTAVRQPVCQSYPWPQDEVIKFWKVKVGGDVCALLNALLVIHVL